MLKIVGIVYEVTAEPVLLTADSMKWSMPGQI